MERLLLALVRAIRGSSLPQLYYKEDSPVAELVEACPALYQFYTPPFWAKNRHVHLIVSGVVRKWFNNPKYRRQSLTAPDGGTVCLDWFRGTDKKKKRIPMDAPIVLVVHALCGDSNDSFVKWMCLAFYKLGWRAVAFNFRGCGTAALTSPKIFCQADTSDIYQSIAQLRRDFPNAPVFAAGFSLGGYSLNKYIGQVDAGVYKEDGRLDGVACLGSGYDFKAEMALSEDAGTMSYEHIILQYWKAYIHMHRKALSKANIDFAAVKKAKTLVEFDKVAVIDMFGYKTVDELYDDSNGLRWIKSIRTPCLLISAEDDPFLDPSVTPEQQCEDSDHVCFCSTRYGSHCAHLQSWWPFTWSWLDVVVAEFFIAILKKQHRTFPTSKERQKRRTSISESTSGGTPGARNNHGEAKKE